ncbi:MAG: hypothetical protein JW797_18035 [Bradymonadales bacterium]|nr:hypothetical protein [Bradymonadales bacterium]
MSHNQDQPPSSASWLPIPKQPFLPDDRFRIRRIGQPDGSGFTVYLFYDVAEEILYASEYRMALNSAGVLTGGYYRGAAGPFVEVRGFQNSAVVENSLEFAHHLQNQFRPIHQDPDLIETGQRPVGWFYSHPGSGAILGPYELMVQLSYFNLPYHLCLVLDPQQRRAGLYCNVGEARLRNIGFNLIEPAVRNGCCPDSADPPVDPQTPSPPPGRSGDTTPDA